MRLRSQKNCASHQAEPWALALYCRSRSSNRARTVHKIVTAALIPLRCSRLMGKPSRDPGRLPPGPTAIYPSRPHGPSTRNQPLLGPPGARGFSLSPLPLTAARSSRCSKETMGRVRSGMRATFGR